MLSAHQRSTFKLRRALAATMVAVAAAAAPLAAGEGIVTVNQHLTDDATGNCVTPSHCDEQNYWQTLPLNTLGQSSHLAGNAYHVGNQCRVAQARCFYNPYSKTKFLSSDVAGLDPATVQTWINQIRQSPHQPGQIHFEHYDACLEDWADDGLSVSDLTHPNSTECFLRGHGSTSPLQMLDWIRDSSGATVTDTMLLQNGYLHVASGSARKLRWKVYDAGPPAAFTDLPKRLVGSGYMGALAAPPERLDIPTYFGVLRSHNSHLIRVWGVEQWVAQAPAATKGPTPFLGSLQPHGYDLATPNPAYFDRLRDFAQQAADRGIVVQLSLFDKHGLICPNWPHQYEESPYFAENNGQGYLPAATCNCSSASGPAPEAPEVINCQPSLDFVDPANYPDLQLFHAQYLTRVGEEVGGIGNVIYEIINEALAPHATPRYTPGDWPEQAGTGTTWNQQWQMNMAKRMQLSLPLGNTSTAKYVVRDAFNGDTNGTLLKLAPGVGKGSDIDGAAWVPAGTNFAQVKVSTTETGGLGPSRLLGYATSDGSDTNMVGTLAFSKPATWTKFQVRADLECNDGILRLGAKSQPSGGDQVYAHVDCPSGGAAMPWVPIRVYENVGGQLRWIGVVTIEPTGIHNFRLRFQNGGGTPSVQVFVDGTARTGDLPLQTTANLAYAYFWGGGTGATYPVDAGKVDNFEVAVFCDDEGRGCTP